MAPLPVLEEAVVFTSPMILDNNKPVHIKGAEKKAWTNKERVWANNAKQAHTADELKDMVFIYLHLCLNATN